MNFLLVGQLVDVLTLFDQPFHWILTKGKDLTEDVNLLRGRRSSTSSNLNTVFIQRLRESRNNTSKTCTLCKSDGQAVAGISEGESDADAEEKFPNTTDVLTTRQTSAIIKTVLSHGGRVNETIHSQGRRLTHGYQATTTNGNQPGVRRCRLTDALSHDVKQSGSAQDDITGSTWTCV
ncbi:hypothetical protein RUM44_005000 [Polyplax serrata]|uniref:Uncharacterized protein n=1 Tax=Polyplax serrata TaxID=468196 RepID=A0ABR1AWM5_POLSC